MFSAIVIDKTDGQYKASLQSLDESALPEGQVTVRIDYSTLNFKDGLAMTGKSPVVRQFPMVPGIDFAGTVTDSSDPNFKSGQKVVLNGWGLGEVHWGGLAQQARVKGDWLIPLPEAFSTQQAMMIGTAGYTAALCVRALQRQGVTPDKEVLAYCRIGERSAHTWFVLRELLGYPDVKNYDGSWTEWGNLVDVPIEKGT